MRVMVIPEDFRKDRYVLQPIIKALVSHVGRATAKVVVCTDPRLHGTSEALSWSHLRPIIERYVYSIDLFLLCVDRDGVTTRRAVLDHLEEQAAGILPEGRLFLAEHAWQEIEVWALAGHDLPTEWNWRKIRAEIHPKERYFVPFAKARGVQSRLGDGRKVLAEEAARRYDRVRQLCREDLMALEERVRTWTQVQGS